MDKKWKSLIESETNKPYFTNLLKMLEVERKNKVIYPPSELIFNAFKLTPFEKVKVIIIGQDPYHNANQANGLAFSVNHELKLPKSLINIFKELENDLGIFNKVGDLTNWATQGVFLINTILTVEHDNPLSHKNIGWEVFTKTVIKTLNDDISPKVFVLWGNHAKNYLKLLDNKKHLIITSAHPSPLSAYNGFWGSKPFSKINKYLKDNKLDPIDWRTI